MDAKERSKPSESKNKMAETSEASKGKDGIAWAGGLVGNPGEAGRAYGSGATSLAGYVKASGSGVHPLGEAVGAKGLVDTSGGF